MTFQAGDCLVPVPVQSCCSVMASSGVTFNARSLLYFRGCWVVILPQKHLVLPPPGEWFLLTILTEDQSESWCHLIESLVGGPWEMRWWPVPLQCHKATARSVSAAPGWDAAPGWQCSVCSPELLAVLCFVQRKAKPFTQPGKRSLPRLVANML